MKVLVTGAGGFIGGHLVKRLLDEGHEVRAVDIKPGHLWWQFDPRGDNVQLDLRNLGACQEACLDVDQVYNLACDMGGMGFIEHNKGRCALSVLINTNLLLAARGSVTVKRYFFSSSACVYPAGRQNTLGQPPLKESDAYPAWPEDGYGWEKLYSERMCRHFREDFGLETRVARFHNVYGPHGSWRDGREKAPAAICRKVAEAKRDGRDSIKVWGDGTQQRSYMWIGDCVEGIRRIMDSDCPAPLNLGSSEGVSVNELVEIVAGIAGVDLVMEYQLDKPTGVVGRNSDNTLIREVLDWEPSTPLATGLKDTYEWIEKQVNSGAV